MWQLAFILSLFSNFHLSKVYYESGFRHYRCREMECLSRKREPLLSHITTPSPLFSHRVSLDQSRTPASFREDSCFGEWHTDLNGQTLGFSAPLYAQMHSASAMRPGKAPRPRCRSFPLANRLVLESVAEEERQDARPKSASKAAAIQVRSCA